MSNPMQLRAAIRAMAGQPIAFSEAPLARLALESIVRMAVDDRVSDEAVVARLRTDLLSLVGEGPAAQAGRFDPVIVGQSGRKSIAYLSARGVALFDIEFQPYAFSTALLATRLRAAAADDTVGIIVLDIDSPGGVVTGVPEAGEAMFEAREKKRVVALVNPLAASAAYWIASQATEIIATPSGQAGSIGVFLMHIDVSKMLEADGVKITIIKDGENKAEGNPFEPLSAESLAYFQGEVARIGSDFRKAVARGRGTTAATVAKEWGGGRAFYAPQAKALGMVDRVEPLTAAIQRLGLTDEAVDEARRRRSQQAVAEAATPAFESSPGLTQQPSAVTDGGDRQRRLALAKARNGIGGRVGTP